MKKAEYEQFSDRNEKEDARQSQLSQLPSPNIGRRRTARNSVRLKKGESGSSRNETPFDITKGYAIHEWATPEERTTSQE